MTGRRTLEKKKKKPCTVMIKEEVGLRGDLTFFFFFSRKGAVKGKF